MNKIKLSDYVAQFIKSLEVKHVFTVSGAGNLHILDSIQSVGGISIICNHHEQASAMAMEAYARASENYGVCVVTFGPGSTNAITGVAGAWMDSIPCLTISGQVKFSDTIQNSGLRQRGIQEIDIVSMVKPITKYAKMIDKVDDIRFELEKAAYISKQGRPGPVWIDIPMDYQSVLIDPSALRSFHGDQQEEKHRTPAYNEMKGTYTKLVSDLEQAKRPVLLLGHGVRLSKGLENLNKVIKKLNIPVLTTWNGADLITSDNELYAGRPGTYGQRGANFTLQNSDFLLSIGARLSIPQTGYVLSEFVRSGKVAVVDIDGPELEKNIAHYDYAFQADANEFLKKLLDTKIGISDLKEWKNFCSTAMKSLPSCQAEYFETKDGINSYVFVNKLQEKLKKNTLIVTDMGTSFTCVHQTIELREGQRIFTSSGLASMGYALPAAIGAALAQPNANIICFVGDGAFQMNIQELSIIQSLKLPIKIVVFNNNGYLTIRQTQDALFKGRYVASSNEYGVICPDTIKIANAYGIDSTKMSNLKEVDEHLSSALASSNPHIIEVMMPEKQLLVPKSSVSIDKNGKISSRPLEDLFPFLPREQFLKYMQIEPLPASLE